MWQNSHKIGEISTEINFGSILNIFKTQKIIYAYLWQNSHRIVEIFPEINFEYFQAQKINLYLFETKFALVLIWIFSDHRKSIYVYLCQNSSKMVEIFPFWIFSNHRKSIFAYLWQNSRRIVEIFSRNSRIFSNHRNFLHSKFNYFPGVRKAYVRKA